MHQFDNYKIIVDNFIILCYNVIEIKGRKNSLAECEKLFKGEIL